MSYTIPLQSLKHDRAVKFGRELTKAMAARNVGTRPVADALGASRTTVMYWRTGRILPRIDSTRKLAEALDWPQLVTLAMELRRKACEVCETEFIDDSGSDNRRFCTMSCQRVAEKRRMGSTVDKRAAVAERKLLVHQRAVAAYCNGCEPSGRCVTVDCELRPVSPLPLFEDRIDIDPVRGGRKPLTEADRVAREAITRGTWSEYTPEERAARIAKTAEASKRGRGLVSA